MRARAKEREKRGQRSTNQTQKIAMTWEGGNMRPNVSEKRSNAIEGVPLYCWSLLLAILSKLRTSYPGVSYVLGDRFADLCLTCVPVLGGFFTVGGCCCSLR